MNRTPDPNCNIASSWRSVAESPNAAGPEGSTGTRRGPLEGACPCSRLDLFARYATELEVLDLGYRGYSPTRASCRPAELSTVVRLVARRYVGADIEGPPESALPRDAPVIKLDVTCEAAAASRVLNGRTFDLVLAGELVEHFALPVRLFELAKAVLRPTGLFVLTAPNPYVPHRTCHGLRNRVWESGRPRLLLRLSRRASRSWNPAQVWCLTRGAPSAGPIAVHA